MSKIVDFLQVIENKGEYLWITCGQPVDNCLKSTQEKKRLF